MTDMSVRELPSDEGAPRRLPSSGRGNRRPRRRRRRPLARFLAGLMVVALVCVGWSVTTTLMTPGGDSVAAKLAEWARDHGLGAVVGWMETAQYDLHPPQEGGTAVVPQIGQAAGVAGSAGSAGPGAPVGGTAGSTVKVSGPIVPAPVVSPAGTNMPSEGAWQAIESVNGTPAMYATFVRPDGTHTSYVAGIVSMDQRLVTFQLHPGEADPGPGNWGAATSVLPADRANLLATFNGGFKIKDSRGGFYLNSQTAGTLTNGAASVVFSKDGHITVGVWGRDAKMTADVVAVRQNLKLIVDQGKVPANVDANVEADWGASIGGSLYVWRSGLGLTADGRVVFVYGPALSVRTLADLLRRAGVVTGLQMEINPAWMSFMYYQQTADPTNPTPVNLLSSQERPANRYLEPTSRDFIQASSR